MSGPQWFLLTAFVVSAAALLYLLFQVISAGSSKDLAARKGNTTPAVLYSLTGAMLPWKKESAHLHLPSYMLGITYHLGTLLSFLWLIALFARAGLPPAVTSASVGFLALTTLCGLALLIKRIASASLRYFSSPDDYFSNILVTGFHALTAAALMYQGLIPGLYVYAGILLLYIPLGKLRHVVYFILARVYLGYFYGRRGIWAGKGDGSWHT